MPTRFRDSSACRSVSRSARWRRCSSAALAALWTTGASVVAREQRRSEAKDLLERAGTELAARGIEIIARVGEFPDFPEEPSRARLDRELSTQSAAALADHEGIEGGYFVQRFKSFLGTAALTGRITQDRDRNGRQPVPGTDAGMA